MKYTVQFSFDNPDAAKAMCDLAQVLANDNIGSIDGVVAAIGYVVTQIPECEIAISPDDEVMSRIERLFDELLRYLKK